MAHTPHELAEEFPEHRDRLHELKENDAHFRRLAEEYHEVNREIHRIESETEPASDDVLTEKRRERAQLKDDIAVMLRKR